MIKRLFAIAFVYACCCVAWMILGGTVVHRTETSEADLGGAVGEVWGGPQVQRAPTFARIDERPTERIIPATSEKPAQTERGTETVRTPVAIGASRLTADLQLRHRRKGLLWHPTYRVAFGGRYRVTNDGDAPGRFEFALPLPDQAAVIGNLALTVDGRAVPVDADGGQLEHTLTLRPGQSAIVGVGYVSQGVSTWQYAFGDASRSDAVRSARDLTLTVTTNAHNLDVPPGTLSPTAWRDAPGGGKALTWRYGTLVAAADLGVAMPQKLNPGPWVSRVTFFAPVSLFLFFFAVFVLSVLRGVRLHPMHYFFLGAACFAFHLLLAYLVDVVTVPAAMALASVASVGLVVSYVRLVAGLRFALVEVGGAQIVYLVGFAATFFLDGTTGLAITLLSVATLFVVMQATAKLDWEALLKPSLETA